MAVFAILLEGSARELIAIQSLICINEHDLFELPILRGNPNELNLVGSASSREGLCCARMRRT
ncbi:hypothetical protein QA641_20605 [Bradyrhizobium sp. CB1650]|uniref:hypothetical protein n=1 Tax=Bradyrhizobium sp. CB1650 TaxID=3039153 RepID=UPI002434CB3A|nr:hypothetical protein [Bradyrhizobium sp. CB1650]WGD56083.1 hypothetical protein QA641_20605 [Bradyrhizobium sp. CB1650]